MLKIVALYLCWTIILVSGNGSVSEIATPLKPSEVSGVTGAPFEPTDKTTPSTTLAPTSTTTHSPNTTTTTTKPPPPPDTTTTAVPTTTVPTTVKPSTTSSPDNVTTTSAPITTTPGPTPKDGTWVVNGTNATCIIIRMAAQFNVTYTTKDNKTQHKLLTLPTDNASTVATGLCDKLEQTVNITWHAGNDSLIVHFVKNETTKRYSMHHVELYLGSHEFPDGESNETLKFVHEADQFPTGLTNSYRCMRLQKLELTRNGTNGTQGAIEISDLQFQAFKSDKSSNFGLAQDCSIDVPDIVPIAVGCALTALVIIILAAYLVSRRRSQARGYLSM